MADQRLSAPPSAPGPPPPSPLAETDELDTAATLERPGRSAGAAVVVRPAAGTPPELTVGGHVGRYVILRRLGEGGMGIVYAAYDAELDRKVAIKLLHDSASDNPERRTRLLREAQAMARISHPNVVNVYEVGEVSGRIYVAMEFVDGVTLAEWQLRPHSWVEILELYRAAGEGLAAAHRAGLVHRDFKPENVLVGGDGRPRVADFGLARSGPEERGEGTQGPAATSSSSSSSSEPGGQRALSPALTVAGTIMGTPLYMSPEQHSGEATDGRSDQFSFCAALFEALYKTLPFAGDNLRALSFNVLSGRLRPLPAGTSVPERIGAALKRGLSVAAEARFPSMTELLAALAVDPRRDPSAAPWARRWFIYAVLAVVAANTVILNVAERRGSLQLWHMQLASVALLSGALVVAVWLRQSLFRNSFHRGLVTMVIIVFAQMVGMRTVGGLLGLSLPQVMAMDMMAMAGSGAAMAALYLPHAWPFVAIAVAAAVGQALYPTTSAPLAVYPVMAIGLAVLWSRAASRKARELSRTTACGLLSPSGAERPESERRSG